MLPAFWKVFGLSLNIIRAEISYAMVSLVYFTCTLSFKDYASGFCDYENVL